MGDCYEAAGKLILGWPYADIQDVYLTFCGASITLCHGEPIRPSDGMPFGHAWLEIESCGIVNVLNVSLGEVRFIPKWAFYHVGKIDTKSRPFFRYHREEARAKILEHSHWGPWDWDPPR